MTSHSSLAVLLDPAWPALGTDSVATNARKALIAAGITPDAAANMPKPELAKTPGLGFARLEHVEAYLRRLADARAADALAKATPRRCPDCGQPRAHHARNVVADHRGHYRSVAGARLEGPFPAPCATCHAHHRQLVDAANTTTGASR